MLKKQLSQKAKLPIYQLIFVPTLTSGHELLVLTQRIRLQIQAGEMSFLHRVARLSLRHSILSLDIRKDQETSRELNIKRCQLLVEACDQDANWAPRIEGIAVICSNISTLRVGILLLYLFTSVPVKSCCT